MNINKNFKMQSWKSFLVIGISFILFFAFVFIQKFLIAKHTLIYGTSYGFWILFVFISSGFIISLLNMVFGKTKYYIAEKNYKEEKHLKIALFMALFINLIILIYASNFYYYATDKGFTYHEFLGNKFFNWDQIKEVQLGISTSGGYRGSVKYHFEYRLIIDKKHNFDIKNFWNSENSIIEVQGILNKNKVPTIIPNYIEEYLKYLEPWEVVIIKSSKNK